MDINIRCTVTLDPVQMRALLFAMDRRHRKRRKKVASK